MTKGCFKRLNPIIWKVRAQSGLILKARALLGHEFVLPLDHLVNIYRGHHNTEVALMLPTLTDCV